jgi:DNA-binding CsgD family transcriptional regulator
MATGPDASETGEALEQLARTRYLAGDYPGSITAHERAFVAYRAEGDVLAASRTARIISWLHVNVFSDFAVAGGWLARAERLLDDGGASDAERGWVELTHATREPYGDLREQRLRDAWETGRSCGDPDLEFAALARLGEVLALTGRVDEGMLAFDEALTAVCAGEVRDLYVVESVFCALFLTCERVHDVVRAEQWLRAAGELVRRRGLVCVGPLCRAHYGGILTAAGQWAEAESELDEAARVFADGYVAARVIVLVRLADLRVRQGRLEEAALMLEGLDQLPDATRPLAALHLASGQSVLARDVLERRLAAPPVPAPWPIGTTTPSPPAVAGPLLALLVDAHLAEGDLVAAVETADRLAEVADLPVLRALLGRSRGRIGAASGSPDATDWLRGAVELFAATQLPVELARTRLDLANAIAGEQPEVAAAEAKAALEVFEVAPALRDADEAAALLRSLGSSERRSPRLGATLTKREAEVLDLLAHGLKNAQIAERLFISTKTAEHHVGHILTKLSLPSRAAAAAYVARNAREGGPE